MHIRESIKIAKYSVPNLRSQSGKDEPASSPQTTSHFRRQKINSMSCPIHHLHPTPRCCPSLQRASTPLCWLEGGRASTWLKLPASRESSMSRRGLFSSPLFPGCQAHLPSFLSALQLLHQLSLWPSVLSANVTSSKSLLCTMAKIQFLLQLLLHRGQVT